MTKTPAPIQDHTLGTLFRYKAWADAEWMTRMPHAQEPERRVTDR